MQITPTEFILHKDNMETRTRSLLAVMKLHSRGWKVKQSKFSEIL